MYKKAEITVFLSLICLAIISFIGALIYSAKVYSAKVRIEGLADLVTRSAFSEYNKELLDDYGLLFVDTTYRGTTDGGIDCLLNHVSQYVDINLTDDKVSGYVAYLSSEITDVVYASDDNYEAVKKQIKKYMICCKGYDENSSEKYLYKEYMKSKNLEPNVEDYLDEIEYYIASEVMGHSTEYDEQILDKYSDDDCLEILYDILTPDEMIEIITNKIQEKMQEENNGIFAFDHLVESAFITYYFEGPNEKIYEIKKYYSLS